MPYAAIDGQAIYYTDTGGSGPVLILAHGFLMDHEMFAPVTAQLRAAARVVVWDQRGFGRTRFDGRPFTFWDSARDCLALLDHLGVERAVVGGMSQGGFVALRVALTAPHRVRGLVLLDTEAGAFTAEERAENDEMCRRWLESGPVDELAGPVAAHIIDDPVRHPYWIGKWRRRPKELFAEPYRALATREDVTGRLTEIGCPALVVHGTGDVAIPLERARLLAAGLPGAADVVQVAGAHAAALTNPLPVASAIRAFLTRLER
ncbi:alpha/beta hydrolase [Phytohabitans flavus]|uniref:Alpha/beta hydrolase n=1 Tax=Phytohabitans flavus TaxID=1076124 RepID=A0A6F8XLW9_9ACTN|nr:alpha/beta hydrolase [Phytohabitans flavus]BCB74803.1 alpha/beta hydrolase [Phytohabitans flavus]